VIGYDDLPLASYTDPPLTTIAQPIERAAARMVEMLLRLMDGAGPDGMQEIWPAELIERASDGPVPADRGAKTSGGNTRHETKDILRL
jgi:DNA-binding LacI/PurR family transcriptional regulator